jgi:hypothetical protein
MKKLYLGGTLALADDSRRVVLEHGNVSCPTALEKNVLKIFLSINVFSDKTFATVMYTRSLDFFCSAVLLIFLKTDWHYFCRKELRDIFSIFQKFSSKNQNQFYIDVEAAAGGSEHREPANSWRGKSANLGGQKSV